MLVTFEKNFSSFRISGLEQRFYKMDSDCVVAGKPLPEFHLYISTVLPLENKGIRYVKKKIGCGENVYMYCILSSAENWLELLCN